jgi:hypothetical protein
MSTSRDGQLSLEDLLADDPILGRDQAEANIEPEWGLVAMAAVVKMAATGLTFQAFDLVEIYAVPEPDHPCRWGPLLARAARDGLIVPVGAAPSRRPATARSLTRTWRGRGAR